MDICISTRSIKYYFDTKTRPPCPAVHFDLKENKLQEEINNKNKCILKILQLFI